MGKQIFFWQIRKKFWLMQKRDLELNFLVVLIKNLLDQPKNLIVHIQTRILFDSIEWIFQYSSEK